MLFRSSLAERIAPAYEREVPKFVLVEAIKQIAAGAMSGISLDMSQVIKLARDLGLAAQMMPQYEVLDKPRDFGHGNLRLPRLGVAAVRVAVNMPIKRHEVGEGDKCLAGDGVHRPFSAYAPVRPESSVSGRVQIGRRWDSTSISAHSPRLSSVACCFTRPRTPPHKLRQTLMWRYLPAAWFGSADVPSWDLREYPLHTLDRAMEMALC